MDSENRLVRRKIRIYGSTFVRHFHVRPFEHVDKLQRTRRWPEMFRTFFLSRLLFSFEDDGRSPLFIFGTLPLFVPFEAMAAVTLELKKRAKQAKSVYIARTVDT